MFFDQFDENWRNSEVMRVFAQIVDEQIKTAECAPVVGPVYTTEEQPSDLQQLPEGERAVSDRAMFTEDGLDCDEVDENNDVVKMFDRLGQIDEVVSGLKKIASEANSNHSSYLIERAISELRDLQEKMYGKN